MQNQHHHVGDDALLPITAEEHACSNKTTVVPLIRQQDANRRQKSLYEMGVKKLRQRNQKVLLLSPQVEVQRKAATGNNNCYFKRLYQHLQNLAFFFITNYKNTEPIGNLSQDHTRITLLNLAAKKGKMAGLLSSLKHDFPELYHFHNNKNSGSDLTSILNNQKKNAPNVSKLHLKSQFFFQQACQKRAERTITSSQSRTNAENSIDILSSSTKMVPHKEHDAFIVALKFGLHGIVYQSLLDVVEEIQRNKIFEKCKTDTGDDTSISVEMKQVESSDNKLLTQFLSPNSSTTGALTKPASQDTSSSGSSEKCMPIDSMVANNEASDMVYYQGGDTKYARKDDKTILNYVTMSDNTTTASTGAKSMGHNIQVVNKCNRILLIDKVINENGEIELFAL
jgi:hypothetical protein